MNNLSNSLKESISSFQDVSQLSKTKDSGRSREDNREMLQVAHWTGAKTGDSGGHWSRRRKKQHLATIAPSS